MRSRILFFNLLVYVTLFPLTSASLRSEYFDYDSDTTETSSRKSAKTLENASEPVFDFSRDNETAFEICIPTNNSKTAAVIEIEEERVEEEDKSIRSQLTRQESDEVIDINDDDSTDQTVTSANKEEIRRLDSVDSFSVNGTEIPEDEDEQEEEEVNPPMFPHVVGIRNHALNCYANSLIACLYNIPLVQEALFSNVLKNIDEPNTERYECIATALSTIFYKMRSTKTYVDLETYFVPAVKNTIQWDFGGLECVLEFWGSFSAALPAEVSDLFKVDGIESQFRKSDNVFIKSENVSSNMIFVSPSEKYKSIEKLLEVDFIDEEAEDFTVFPEDQHLYAHLLDGPIEEKVKVNRRSTFKITNKPKVLIFGVKRVYWDASTNSSGLITTTLEFPENLELNEEEYTCVGNVEYDPVRGHYFAQNLDLLNDQWYTHDDKKVDKIPDTNEAFTDLSERFYTKSCMVFYIKTSLIDEYIENESKLAVPLPVIAKLTSRGRKSFFKRKRDVDPDNIIEIPIAPEEPQKITRRRLQNKRKIDTIESVESVDVNEPEIIVKAPQEEPVVQEKIKKVRGPYKKNVIRKKPAQAKESAELQALDLTASASDNDKLAETSDIQISESTAAPKLAETSDIQISEPSAAPEKPAKKFKSHNLIIRESDDGLKYFRSSLGDVVDFRLGQNACMFNDQEHNVYLEHILVALSQSQTVVKILFEEVKTKSPSDFIFRFTLVILKILLGHGDVSTAELTKELVEVYNFDFKDVRSTWTQLSQLLPEKISPVPSFKLIKYRNDEPVEIFEESQSDYITLRPYFCKPYPHRLNLNGVFTDIIDVEGPELFRRNIFKSDGVILPIKVSRIRNNPDGGATYDESPIYIDTYDRTVYSYIGYDPCRKETFSVHWNAATLSQVILFYKGMPRVVKVSEELAKMIQHGLLRYSELILLAKKDDLKQEMPMLSDVPRVLLDELNINQLLR